MVPDAMAMRAMLYLDPRCFLCRFVEPGVRWWFFRRGIEIGVYKVRPHMGRLAAERVNGTDWHYADDVTGFPALRVGPMLLVGSGIVGFLKQATKGY